MELGWTEEQDRRYEACVAFAREHLDRDLRERDAAGTFDRAAWDRAAEFGVLGWCMPTEYGGAGLDVVTTVRMLEGIGYGTRDNGLTLGLNGQVWAVQEPILAFGTDEQKRRWLEPLARGRMLGAHGMTEPSSGSDTYALETTAEKVDGGYVLDGRKVHVGLAPIADVALIFAKTNPAAGAWGISAFIVDASSDGYVASPPRDKMGLRTGSTGDIELTRCFVPEENRLGPEGVGVSLFTTSMQWERAFIFTSHVGSMARQLDETVAFAREREQFGQSIGKFQAVSHRIADMRVRLETARLWLYRLAWMLQEGRPAVAEAAMCKLQLSEAFLANSLDAMRIHGAKGYFTEYEIERDLRDSAGGVIYSGTNEIQRNIIARSLGL